MKLYCKKKKKKERKKEPNLGKKENTGFISDVYQNIISRFKQLLGEVEQNIVICQCVSGEQMNYLPKASSIIVL